MVKAALHIMGMVTHGGGTYSRLLLLNVSGPQASWRLPGQVGWLWLETWASTHASLGA